jgi:hypothetical protein
MILRYSCTRKNLIDLFDFSNSVCWVSAETHANICVKSERDEDRIGQNTLLRCNIYAPV